MQYTLQKGLKFLYTFVLLLVYYKAAQQSSLTFKKPYNHSLVDYQLSSQDFDVINWHHLWEVLVFELLYLKLE